MNEDELRILLPGEKREFEKFDVMVYPIGFNQIRNFTETLISSLRIVFNQIDLDESKLDNAEEMKKIGMKVITLLSPIASKDLLGIFKDCIVTKTKPDKDHPDGEIIIDGINYIPHWNVAPLIVDWLKVSFMGAEKIRPWIEAMKDIKNQMKNVNLKAILA